MSPYRCDGCGKFCGRLNDVWCNPYWNGIDREVCDDCFSNPAVVVGVETAEEKQ